VGRLSFAEDWGCTSPIAVHQVSWQDCHAFKRHFDPATGGPIAINGERQGALRPLTATLKLSYFELLDRTPAGAGDPAGNKRLCFETTIQTRADGTFRVLTSGCQSAGTPILIVGEALLAWRLREPDGNREGWIRAVWERSAALDLFPDLGGDPTSPGIRDGTLYKTSDGKTYAVPRLVFAFLVPGGEPARRQNRNVAVNIGNQVFLADPAIDEFSYMRQVLSAYRTMIELFIRLRDADRGNSAFIDQMFVKGQPVSGTNYTIQLDTEWAFGSRGGIQLYRPNRAVFEAEGTSLNARHLLSDTSVISHEFGHSIHGGMAPVSFHSDYSFANPLRRPFDASDTRPRDYDWGHGSSQYQEMGTAYTEGVASAVGQFLLNRCEGANPGGRPGGGADPFPANMWLPDTSCDSSDGCAYHHVRWHLNRRGLTETTPDWNARVDALNAMNFVAFINGMRFVTSNSEERYAGFVCDLLDTDTDVSYAPDRIVTGQQYIPDYTAKVAQILDGVTLTSPYGITGYASGVMPETVTVSFQDLVRAMAGFCAACPGGLPGNGNWAGNISRTNYIRSRLSALDGDLSPQAMARYLLTGPNIQSRPALNAMQNLLRANFMEDELNTSGSGPLPGTCQTGEHCRHQVPGGCLVCVPQGSPCP
jgi:hypothetical protein